ncbi:MAG: flagellar cap protein FliD N-terminal domain-containing protein, partial [bacterium]
MVSNISFSGLISGLSSDQIIEAILTSRRAPITQLENQAELKSFEKTAYQFINLQATAVKRALLNLRLQSTFLTRKAISSSQAHLGVKAGFNATPGIHSVTISSVAQGARAISGLDNRALERAAAKMAYGNTAGITTIAMTANNLGGTRAVADTLLTETLQAGSGDAKITQGDRIKIDVTLKDSSTNTVYFTFQNDGTDTVERLRQTVRAAFKGEAQVAIDSNGAFLITETDPSAAGSISLDGLTFSDEDYSGSTFTFSVGGTTAGNTSTARTIVGTRTFTTGSSANIADGTELLTALDQWGGGTFSGDETIEISGKQYDGTDVSSSFAVSATTTLNDLITELQTLFNDATNPPWETTVTLENGKIVLRDQTAGASETAISMYFYDPTGSLDLQTGTFVTTDAGSDDITQTIRTSAFTESAVGRHIVTSTDGVGGSVTGTVSLDAGTILSSLGVTETGLFTIDRDDGGGAIDPVTVFGVTSKSTVQDLIVAINAQVPGVTAQLVDDGAGAYFFKIVAAEGGIDIRLTDDAAGNGILENVLNPDTGSTDTDISTLNDSALASVESATTTGDDYTFTTIFTPENGGPVQRRTVTGSIGTAVTDLIANVRLQGAGNNFNTGDALIYTNISSELNVGPATSTYILGNRGVSDTANTSTPALNIYTTIDNSGSAAAITSGTFTINGVRITIDNTDSMSIDEVLGLINSSGAGV